METFHFGQDTLTVSKALDIAHNKMILSLTNEIKEKINKSSDHVSTIANGNKAVYGINTGFGPLCTTQISPEETALLQENLLKSHAVGVGNPIAPILAKLMMIIKVQALAQGFSGVRLVVIERIKWMIESDLTPVVPEKGSVGASGDLAPLSHLFLPLIGEGEVWFQGSRMNSIDALNKLGKSPLQLGPKEGLGLINGTQFIAAHAILVVSKLHNVLQAADICGALMVEGLKGSTSPYLQELHQIRPFKGNQFVAGRMSRLLENSEINDSHKDCDRVQDPYSLRCIPQVHGASRTAWLHLKELVEIEINSVTDNPIVFDSDHTVSGGNFHGQPLAMALDYACLAASELGNISDRRSYLALEGKVDGVPKLLMKDLGSNSGFMIPQYTSAALASENKSLCHPASADSIPTSLGQEDHVSMGSISGRKALQVVQNVEKILGIELLSACQAIDFHRPLKSSNVLDKIHEEVRTKIPHLEKDEVLYPHIESAIELISSGTVVQIERLFFSENTVLHNEIFDTF